MESRMLILMPASISVFRSNSSTTIKMLRFGREPMSFPVVGKIQSFLREGV